MAEKQQHDKEVYGGSSPSKHSEECSMRSVTCSNIFGNATVVRYVNGGQKCMPAGSDRCLYAEKGRMQTSNGVIMTQISEE